MDFGVIFNRVDMGFSLSIHIILAVIGIAMPLFIMVSEVLGQKLNNIYYKIIARRFLSVFILLFAIGTASGTLVAVNLLFLWPSFMKLIGQVAILPVYMEVFAFFGESIFIGIYIYSKDKISTYKHAAIMGVISIFAVLSAVFITLLNAFMNTPVGFDISAYLNNGLVTNINPYAVFTSPSAFIEIFHVVSTSYLVGAFIIVLFFAYRLFRDNKKDPAASEYYRSGLRLALFIAFIAVVFAIFSGLLSISSLYTLQPEKFAALELDLNTTSHAPEYIFGTIINSTRMGYLTVIPNVQSILATGSSNGTVPGLLQYPQNTWPPSIVHNLFDLMVFLGFGLGFFFVLLIIFKFLNVKIIEDKRTLLLCIIAAIVSIFLLEGGWVMAEFGRQPWIIYNVMSVSQAANYSTSIIPVAIAVILFYVFIIPATLFILKGMFKKKSIIDDIKVSR